MLNPSNPNGKNMKMTKGIKSELNRAAHQISIELELMIKADLHQRYESISAEQPGCSELHKKEKMLNEIRSRYGLGGNYGI